MTTYILFCRVVCNRWRSTENRCADVQFFSLPTKIAWVAVLQLLSGPAQFFISASASSLPPSGEAKQCETAETPNGVQTAHVTVSHALPGHSGDRRGGEGVLPGPWRSATTSASPANESRGKGYQNDKCFGTNSWQATNISNPLKDTFQINFLQIIVLSGIFCAYCHLHQNKPVLCIDLQLSSLF